MLTRGIPAEYVGAPGLLSSVITKSGTNRLSGSVNYFFQNDGLVAENRNASDQEFSRFDTALTGGGPIVTDEAWFFGSYRRVGRNDTVVALDGIDVIRTVEEAQDQFYARGTWAPSTNNTGRSKTSSSAASGSTTSTSATPRATRTPRWCRPAGTPSTAA